MPVYTYPYANTNVTSTATLVIGAEVKLKSIEVYNPNQTEVFIQIFQALTAVSVTVGTTARDRFISVNPSDGVTSGKTFQEYEVPIFMKGVVIAATTSPSNNTTPSTACAVSILYHY